MNIYDIRTQIELEQYTVKQAMVAVKAAATADDTTVMMDIVLSLLSQAYIGLGDVVNQVTQFSRSCP